MFDLLPSDNSICPKVNEMDGEVETFELMSAQKVLENIVARRIQIEFSSRADGLFHPTWALHSRYKSTLYNYML